MKKFDSSERLSFLVLLALCSVFCFLLSAVSFADIPKIINIQGVLFNNSTKQPVTGQQTVNIYIVPSVPDPVIKVMWFDVGHSITFNANGQFTTNLDLSGWNPDFNRALDIQIVYDGNTLTQSLTSVPYALNADKMGGLPVTSFVTIDAIGSVNVNKNGKVAALKVINTGADISWDNDGIYAEAGNRGISLYAKNTGNNYSGFFNGGKGVKIVGSLEVTGGLVLSPSTLSSLNGNYVLKSGDSMNGALSATNVFDVNQQGGIGAYGASTWGKILTGNDANSTNAFGALGYFDQIGGLNTNRYYGVYGKANDFGVYGESTAVGGYGVNAIGYNGIQGKSTNSKDVSDIGFGVAGSSKDGNGVFGVTESSDYWKAGVYGLGNNGKGVMGYSSSGTGIYGVGGQSGGYFQNPDSSLVAKLADTSKYEDLSGFSHTDYSGVYGKYGNNIGILGSKRKAGLGEDHSGVYGESNGLDSTNKGVVGVSDNGYGVHGSSVNRTGVFGNGGKYGGEFNSDIGYGVHSKGYLAGVYAESTSNTGAALEIKGPIRSDDYQEVDVVAGVVNGIPGIGTATINNSSGRINLKAFSYAYVKNNKVSYNSHIIATPCVNIGNLNFDQASAYIMGQNLAGNSIAPMSIITVPANGGFVVSVGNIGKAQKVAVDFIIINR